MDNTQKILITLIVILGAVLLVSNINRITGKQILQWSGPGGTEYVPKEVPTTTVLKVDPLIVKSGTVATLNFEVTVGDQGSDGEVSVYSPGGSRVAEVQLRGCGDTCTPSEGRVETATTAIGTDWTAGEYYASVIDKGSGEEVKVYFNVE